MAMSITTSILPTVEALEKDLSKEENPRMRLDILDKLATHFSFVNIRRAQRYLAEIDQILKDFQLPDFQLTYYWNCANIENQLYNYSLSRDHFSQALTLVDERGNATQQVELFIDYTALLINEEKNEEVDIYLKRAQRLLEAFPNDHLLLRLKIRQGYLYFANNNYSRAMELFFESEKLYRELSDTLNHKDLFMVTLLYTGLARVYEQSQEMQNVAKSYQRATEISEKYNLRTRLSWHYNNVGYALLQSTDIKNAEIYFQKSIRVKDDFSQEARASSYMNLGVIRYLQKKMARAFEFFNRSEALFRAKKSKDFDENISRIEIWKGRLFMLQKKKSEAENCFERAIDHAKKVSNYQILKDAHGDLKQLYVDNQMWKDAYKCQEWYQLYQQKYLDQTNARKLKELEIKYQAEQKEAEAKLLRLEAAKLQLKALRAQMNPHFVYNALNSIQNYVTSNDPKQASTYLARFAQLMRHSLEYSDREVISLEKEIDFLHDYLYVNAKLRFEDRLSYKVEVDDDLEDDILGVPTMIVQPYVENAIEHGLRHRQNGLVKVSFALGDTEDYILCVVEDNGIGREAAARFKMNDPSYVNHRSLGTRITQDRLELLNQTRKEEDVHIKIIDLKDDETGEAAGTRVEIKIPIMEVKLRG